MLVCSQQVANNEAPTGLSVGAFKQFMHRFMVYINAKYIFWAFRLPFLSLSIVLLSTLSITRRECYCKIND